MTRLRYRIDTSCVSDMVQAARALPPADFIRFRDEWAALEQAGAELVDVQFETGRAVCVPSDDYRRHCAKFGVVLCA